jgi:hypothetical protein
MRESDSRIGRKTDRTQGKPAKTKKYVTPKLIEYGSTSKLSASKPGSFADGANTIHMTQK